MPKEGLLLGVQFDALFTDELYKEIGRNAIETAAVLKKRSTGKRIDFFWSLNKSAVYYP